MSNGNTGSKISDYDGATAAVMGGTAAANAGGGAALIAMSETFHVVIGSIFLALGVFNFFWLLTHRVRHRAILEALGWERRKVEDTLSRAPVVTDHVQKEG